MDDDAVKKNTDCVYFLASPLTCKKGNDCEFRHSESARVNPRDCRYWLSGNCLNWDCPFRHPPLEGRSTVAAGTGPPGPGGGASKSRVPCYFFSQGYCAKGEKCPYMHGSPSLQNLNLKTPASQRAAKATPGSTPESIEKASDAPSSNGGQAKSSQLEISARHVPSEVRPPNLVQSNQKDVRSVSVSGATQNGGTRGRTDGPVVSSGHVGSRLRLRQVQPGDDRVSNGMEPDEWWEESSPGFDVLVDDGPEQSRYVDDPEFQSAGETGLDSGKVAGGNRGRGRSMRMTDEMEQYEYDFPNHYDHPSSYEGGSYDHGGYDYNAHDQQGGYDPSNAYDRAAHQRSAYPSDEMLARDRLGIPMDVDKRSGITAHDQRPRLVKRRRPEGGQQHVSDNHAVRQRTEMPLDDYQHHRRQQEDQQKQHELQLRHQLFIQHGIRNNSRRVHEKTGVEPGVIARRALHEISSSDVGAPPVERVPLRNMTKGRPNEHPRVGVKDVDIHSRLSKGVNVYGEAESRNFMDLEGNRKSEKEVRKEPSTFAGPKTLAQIRAEKRKSAVEEPTKLREAPNGLKPSAQASTQLKGAIAAVDVASLEALSVEEKTIKLNKVVTQEPKKMPNFEGPKPLSVILKEKRRVESEMDQKSEDANEDHLQRILPPSSKVIASRVETGSDVNSRVPELDADVGADVGCVEVEDGEFLSDDDEDLKAKNPTNNIGRESPILEAPALRVECAATRDTQPQEEDRMASDVIVQVEEHMVQQQSNGAGDEADLEYNEGHEYKEDGREDAAEPEQDEDGYALDEDDEDDFAKKLGGFFS